MIILISILLVFISFLYCGISIDNILSPKIIHIGDHINYTIQLQDISDESVNFHEFIIEGKFASVIKEEYGLASITYTLVFWESGEFKLPPVSIDIMEHGKLIATLLSDTMTVNVLGSLMSPEDSLREIKGMQDIQLKNPYMQYLYVFIVIISIIIIYILLKNRKDKIQKAEKWVKPQDSPFIQAHRSIENLATPFPVTEKSAEQFYLNLSIIFREYIENEFFIKTLEMTTKEIDEKFTGMGIDTGIVSKTIHMLNKFDMFKFAGRIPESSEFETDKVFVQTIITEYHQQFTSIMETVSRKGIKK